MDHVRLLAKVTAGHHLRTARLCRCVQEGRGHQRGHTQAPGAPGSLTWSVKEGARLAEVTNPGHKGKRNCCQQEGCCVAMISLSFSLWVQDSSIWQRDIFTSIPMTGTSSASQLYC